MSNTTQPKPFSAPPIFKGVSHLSSATADYRTKYNQGAFILSKTYQRICNNQTFLLLFRLNKSNDVVEDAEYFDVENPNKSKYAKFVKKNVYNGYAIKGIEIDPNTFYVTITANLIIKSFLSGEPDHSHVHRGFSSTVRRYTDKMFDDLGLVVDITREISKTKKLETYVNYDREEVPRTSFGQAKDVGRVTSNSIHDGNTLIYFLKFNRKTKRITSAILLDVSRMKDKIYAPFAKLRTAKNNRRVNIREDLFYIQLADDTMQGIVSLNTIKLYLNNTKVEQGIIKARHARGLKQRIKRATNVTPDNVEEVIDYIFGCLKKEKGKDYGLIKNNGWKDLVKPETALAKLNAPKEVVEVKKEKPAVETKKPEWVVPASAPTLITPEEEQRKQVAMEMEDVFGPASLIDVPSIDDVSREQREIKRKNTQRTRTRTMTPVKEKSVTKELSFLDTLEKLSEDLTKTFGVSAKDTRDLVIKVIGFHNQTNVKPLIDLDVRYLESIQLVVVHLTLKDPDGSIKYEEMETFESTGKVNHQSLPTTEHLIGKVDYDKLMKLARNQTTSSSLAFTSPMQSEEYFARRSGLLHDLNRKSGNW